MKTIKIKTQKELENFLKVLAEESVLAARTSVSKPPEQARQKAFSKAISKGIAALNEEDPEDSADAGTPPAETPPAQQAPDSAAPPSEEAPKSEPKQVDTDFNPSLESLIDAIKDMRGGKGTSDTLVRDSLSAYFDKLEEAERTSLIVMLRSIAGIMSGKYRDQPAPQPSDYNIFTTKKPESGGEKPQQPAPSGESPAPAAASPGAAEDTAPPIKVGEPVSEAYRAKISNLLSKYS